MLANVCSWCYFYSDCMIIKFWPGLERRFGRRAELKFYRPISNIYEISKIAEKCVRCMSPWTRIILSTQATMASWEAVQQLQHFSNSTIFGWSSSTMEISKRLRCYRSFPPHQEAPPLYGFQSDTVKWFKSYLTGRIQNVQIESKVSYPLPVPWVVP